MNVRKRIKAIIIDVDGTLTDGRIHISDSGELFKSFYCRDGLGLQVAIRKGIEPIILTSRSSRIVNRRADELGIRHVLQNFADKKKDGVLEIMKLLGLPGEQIAYIGDDINDLEAMKLCGLTGCPSDSVKLVREQADYICNLKGGAGAVREFIEYLLGTEFDY